MQNPAVGSSVVFVDSFGHERAALVTANHGGTNPVPAECSINVVIVSDNPDEGDSYGRQIKRETSVVHQSRQSAGGNFWR